MKRTSIVCLIAAGLTATAGVASAQRWRPAPPPSPYHQGGWQLVGEAYATGRDVVSIDIGPEQGRFRELMIVVDGEPVELRNVVVQYGNGRRHLVARRLELGFDDRRERIQLRGPRGRFVESVRFRVDPMGRGYYRDTWRRGSQILVYGRDVRFDRGWRDRDRYKRWDRYDRYDRYDRFDRYDRHDRDGLDWLDFF